MQNPTERPQLASATRRRVVVTAALLPAFVLAGRGEAEQAQHGSADFLFVQTAKAMAFSAHQNRLTLRDVSSVTLFFSDRPERIAGTMETKNIVPFWSEGNDSFLSDPPNADISILEDGSLLQTVAVMRDPVLNGDDLHYTVKIVEGHMPELGSNVSVFMDVIGMPLAAISFAGTDRRAFRRAALY